MIARPCDHLLHVHEGIGELRGRAQPVVRADAHPTPAREPVQKRPGLAVLAAADEAAAVEVHEHGSTARAGRVAVDVEPVPRAGVAVAEIRHVLDPAPAHAERREEDDGPRESSVGDRSGEACLQRRINRGPGAQGASHDDRQPDGSGNGQRERGPPDRRCDISLHDRECGRRDEPESATNGSSLIAMPKRKLSDASARGRRRGATAARVGAATSTDEMR